MCVCGSGWWYVTVVSSAYLVCTTLLGTLSVTVHIHFPLRLHIYRSFSFVIVIQFRRADRWDEKRFGFAPKPEYTRRRIHIRREQHCD